MFRFNQQLKRVAGERSYFILPIGQCSKVRGTGQKLIRVARRMFSDSFIAAQKSLAQRNF